MSDAQRSIEIDVERDGTGWAVVLTADVGMFHIFTLDCGHKSRADADLNAGLWLSALASLAPELTQVGVDYCTTHEGIRNEDEHCCDTAPGAQFDIHDDGDPCAFVSLFFRTKESEQINIDHLEHLARNGALNEAGRIFEAFERGENPLQPIPIDEFLLRTKENEQT